MSCVKQWLSSVHIIILIVILTFLLPVLTIVSIQREIKKQEKTALVGGMFVLLALPISIYEIAQHMRYYSRPSLQKYIIRILWMVPTYALNGWIGLVYPDFGIYVDCARECYEAYVIYNFLVYLLSYLNAEMDLEINLALKPQIKHYFPLCWLPNWRMGRELVYNCKHGILQYTLIRTLTTGIAFLCELKGIYGEGEFRGDVAFPYIIAVNNLSQFIAMYCLVLFYRANKEELKPMDPIGKFLCIKAVVFFSFFQGVLIAIAVNTGILNFLYNTGDIHNVTALTNKLQNFLICIEMFLAAVAHHYSFSYKPYINDLVEKRTLWDALITMWDISDVQEDLKEHLGAVGNSISSINSKLRGTKDPSMSSLLSRASSSRSGYNSIDT